MDLVLDLFFLVSLLGRPCYMDISLYHALSSVIRKLRTSSDQLEIETCRVRQNYGETDLPIVPLGYGVTLCLLLPQGNGIRRC